MERKYIFFIFLFVFYIVSCASPTGNISDISKYSGTYQSEQATLQKRSLILYISNNGGLGLVYNDTNTTGTTTSNSPFTVDATNIVGADPFYSFQNNAAMGTLRFASTKKVYVTFAKLVPDYYRFGETLCTN